MSKEIGLYNCETCDEKYLMRPEETASCAVCGEEMSLGEVRIYSDNVRIGKGKPKRIYQTFEEYRDDRR